MCVALCPDQLFCAGTGDGLVLARPHCRGPTLALFKTILEKAVCSAASGRTCLTPSIATETSGLAPSM